MGITGIIAIVVLIILMATCYMVISGIRQRNRQKVILSIIGFATLIACLYFGLTAFITSM